MKVSTYKEEEDNQVEAATDLVTREVKRKKVVVEVSLQRAHDIVEQINNPAEVLLKGSSGEQAQKVVELAENIQRLVVASDLMDAAEKTQMEDATCSEAAALEATRGNSNSHNISNVIEVESSSTSTSSNIDNIPLNKVYANLHKSLTPSSSTKHQKKPDDDTFVPMYPSVLNRITNLSQMRIDVCNKLPTNHHLQPHMVEPLQIILADAEVRCEQVELNLVFLKHHHLKLNHQPKLLNHLC